MEFLTKKEKIVILAVVFIIISMVLFRMSSKNETQAKYEPLNIISTINLEDDLDKFEEITTIMVHISGQVYKPGIVQLDMGKRVIDAIDLAGGLKKEADLDRINLAKKLLDEEKIYIPKVGEVLNDDIMDLQLTSISSNINSTNKININKCSQMDLESLPGIGPVLALRIIDYRTSNAFKTVEDLKEVSGIGDKKYESLKDLITVK